MKLQTLSACNISQRPFVKFATARLNRLLADAMLDHGALKDLLEKKR